MGDNTLTSLSDPHAVVADDFNQFFTALAGDFVPRNASGSSGAPQDDTKKLGTPTYRWNEAHISNLFLGGSLFDPDNVGVDSDFAINSGASRSGSDQPDFLRASGAAATVTILAETTNLQITANGTSITISSDISVTSLTTAPTTNNTCLVNDTSLSGGDETLHTGEAENDPITIDTVGTEISNRIGQYICLKHNVTGEYMLMFVESATKLTRGYRGFFFDSSGNPVTRKALSNNDQLNIMSLGWVFLENNGTTTDVTYNSPVYSAAAPASPVTGDYWFDLTNRLWKRYDGSSFQQVDRQLLGLAVIDDTNCVASRSFDFAKKYSEQIDLEVQLESVTKVRTDKGYSRISVYGRLQDLYAGVFDWDITADLESGLTEGSSTYYYLYVTEDGAPKISEERPYNREHDLRGWYHPYHSWRFVGMAYNDGSSNLIKARSKNNPYLKRIEVFTSSGTFAPLPNANRGKATVVGGGGGGGGNSNGSTGGTSSFGSYASATGGAGGLSADSIFKAGGNGGSGNGGSLNIEGGDGSSSVGGEVAGNGGSSLLGGGGKFGLAGSGGSNAGAGNIYGGGGGGLFGTTSSSSSGGGGGASIVSFNGIKSFVTVTRGAGGSNGGNVGGISSGAGAAGVVIVEY